LAPGLHGATRTGRAFVGDASGEFLFAALHRRGFATHPEPARARLRNARITNVVKCLPPGNAPVSSEINTCMGYLRTELRGFCPLDARRPRVVLSLGGVAHRAVCRALEINRAPFVHGGEWLVRPHFWLLSSFHPSRLNVNTRRLTADMLDTVLERAAACLD
jgi:uracil-DNA glycosylase family 4